MYKISILILLILLLSAFEEAEHFEYKNTTIDSTYFYLTQNDMYSYSDQFDTVLSGDYWLKFKVYRDNVEDELIQSLTLMQGNKIIKKISETSFGMLYKNLGYIGADFDSTFVFIYHSGRGNPTYFHLLQKNDGNDILQGFWVDIDETNSIFLYADTLETGILKIFDIKHKKIENIKTDLQLDCSKIDDMYWEYGCISLDTVTATEIILELDIGDEYLRKTYKRE